MFLKVFNANGKERIKENPQCSQADVTYVRNLLGPKFGI